MSELVSIVIPAYNEGDTLSNTVRELVSATRESGYLVELVIVNDGSSDNTDEVIRSLQAEFSEVQGVLNTGRHGYGYAVRRGLAVYQGDSVVIAMADGSDNPEDVVRYLDGLAQGYDCVFGSRFQAGTTVKNYPPFKKVVNRIGNRVIAALLKSEYDDFTNGFKAYRRTVLDRMQPLHAGQFNLTVEMSIKAVSAGATFKTIPTDWCQRDAGSSSFNLLKQILLYGVTIHWVLRGGLRFMSLIEQPARVGD